MTEAETRAEYLGPALRAAGWSVVDGSRILREKQGVISPGRWQVGQSKSYATNGQKIYRMDMASGLECDLAQYPSTGGRFAGASEPAFPKNESPCGSTYLHASNQRLR